MRGMLLNHCLLSAEIIRSDLFFVIAIEKMKCKNKYHKKNEIIFSKDQCVA
jgi:hypothetical protein